MSNQTEAILKRYPEAVSAVGGVRVGDVLCNDISLPLRIVNESNVDFVNDPLYAISNGFFIIGNADRVVG